ncbi:MAG: phosphotransferase family protein, partial [Halioglobus sp.]
PATPRVSNLQPLTGGAASTTWQFDADSEAVNLQLILRLAPGSGTMEAGLDKSTEALVQSAAAASGVPVAGVQFVLAPEDGLGEGYVMMRLPGESIPRKILRDDGFSGARERMTAQCGEFLARIHRVDIRSVPNLPALSAPLQLQRYEQIYRQLAEPMASFELAFRWLHQHCPAAQQSCLVHGDFRNGNFLVDPVGGITTVLDWELAHRGDPMEDLGWLCVNSWRFGYTENPVGGFGQREALYAAYEAAGGASVDPERVRFWEFFGVLKWGVMCLQLTQAHLDGDVRSVERAAIGRRVSEVEIDLLTFFNATMGSDHGE